MSCGGNGGDDLQGGTGDDTCYGGAGNDSITEANSLIVLPAGHDTYFGGYGNDYLMSGAGNDQLFGGPGDDFVGARGGINTVYGDVGNDTIFVEVHTSSTNAYGGAGIDTLHATMRGAVGVNWSMAIPGTLLTYGIDNSFFGFEKLEFLGSSGDDRVIGSGLDDSISGYFGNDTLSGGSGMDILDGEFGNDRIDGGSGNDYLRDGEGSDTLLGGVGDDSIELLVDNAIDSVDGGLGRDLLIWDQSDTDQPLVLSIRNANVAQILSDGTRLIGIESLYIVGGSGSDAVTGGDFNDLIYGGAGNDLLTGGNGIDQLVGNEGNDRLDGGLGADSLQGGSGNDLYIVDSFMDRVNEAFLGSSGIDTIYSSINFSLNGAQVIGIVENLVLIWTAVMGSGNSGSNSIHGNLSANTLTGGAGQDRFVFRTALGTVDRITDFNVTDDSLLLDNAIFTTLIAGALTAAEFHIGVGAADLSDRIIYNSATGALIYDANGSGAGGAVQFATLTAGLALTAADVLVV